MNDFYSLIIRFQINHYGGPLYGTEYDYSNSCPKCGTGAQVIDSLILPKLKTKKEIFQNLDGTVIICKDLHQKLLDNDINSFYPIYDLKGKQQDFFALKSQNVLGQFDKGTSSFEVEKQCQYCHRDGYFNIPNEPLKLVYSNWDSRLFQFEILSTWECFGNSRLRIPEKESVFANPIYVISDKVKETICDYVCKGIQFEKVLLN